MPDPQAEAALLQGLASIADGSPEIALSIRQLGDRLGWSKSKVGRVLKETEGRLFERRQDGSIRLLATVPQPVPTVPQPVPPTVPRLSHGTPDGTANGTAWDSRKSLIPFPVRLTVPAVPPTVPSLSPLLIDKSKRRERDPRDSRHAGQFSIEDAFRLIRRSYPNSRNSVPAWRAFQKFMASCSDPRSAAIRMTDSARLAARLPRVNQRFICKPLDWFVREGWRDDWAAILEFETADEDDPGALAPCGPKECAQCDSGWVVVSRNGVECVERCGLCHPAKRGAAPAVASGVDRELEREVGLR